MKNHRFLETLDNKIQKGINSCFFYGNIDDYFLFDFYLGIRSLRENLIYYFKDIKNFDIVIVIKEDRTFIPISKHKGVLDISQFDDLFNIKKERGGFGATKRATDSSKHQKQTEQLKQDNAETPFVNRINKILKNSDKKIALIVENFEWLLGLYSNEPQIEYINLFRKILNTNIHTIITMKKLELLEEYGFEFDDKNRLFIPNPSIEELSKTYRRIMYKNYPDKEINEFEFEDIIASIQGSKKTLKEAIRILQDVIKDKQTLSKELFKGRTKEIEKVTFDNVILDDSIKLSIQQRIENFLEKSQTATKGIVLYGPPGTGKTFIAKAVAYEYGMNFMAPSLSDLKGEFVGQSAKQIKMIFEEAKANAPTILFLDEVDTIFTARGTGDSFVNDMVNQFLVEIDGAIENKDVFVICATNRLESIDSAVISRFPDRIYISLPNRFQREEIINSKFKKFNLKDFTQEEREDILNKTEGLSGRDITNLMKKITQLGEENITKEKFDIILEVNENEFIDKFQKDVDVEIIKNPNITFKDVIGYDNIKTLLKEEAEYLLLNSSQKEKMKQFNILPPKGTILYGPPGNGKTTFAKALAGEYNMYYIQVISKDFVSNFVTDTIKKLETIFENSIKLSKMTKKNGVILFFDEIDALLLNVDLSIRATLLKLLEEKIRDFDSKVILISATNVDISNFDPALIRDGRFDIKIKIENPTKEEGLKILRKLFENDKNIDLKTDNFEKIYVEGLSIAQLKAIKDSIKRKEFYKNPEGEKIVIREFE